MSVELYLSGGAANADPDLSLGGVMSSVRLYSQSLAWAAGSIGGVTLVDAAGNTQNSGTLAFTFATNSITWQPAGNPSPGPPIDLTGVSTALISVPSSFDVYSPKGSILISVVEGSLPGADAEADVTVSNIVDNLFPEVPLAEAESGSVLYRGVYVKNVGTRSLYIAAAVSSASTGGDIIRVGLAPAYGQMQTIADEGTAPAGVSFSNRNRPDTSGAIFVPPTYSLGLWVQRTVEGFASTGATPATAQLKIFTY